MDNLKTVCFFLAVLLVSPVSFGGEDTPKLMQMLCLHSDGETAIVLEQMNANRVDGRAFIDFNFRRRKRILSESGIPFRVRAFTNYRAVIDAPADDYLTISDALMSGHVDPKYFDETLHVDGQLNGDRVGHTGFYWRSNVDGVVYENNIVRYAGMEHTEKMAYTYSYLRGGGEINCYPPRLIDEPTADQTNINKPEQTAFLAAQPAAKPLNPRGGVADVIIEGRGAASVSNGLNDQ